MSRRVVAITAGLSNPSSTRLLTDQLIDDRWQAAMNPDALATGRTMYGSASFEMRSR